MSSMLAMLFVTLPLDAFGRVVGGHLITPSDIVCALIAMPTLGRLTTRRYVIHARGDKALIAFMLFIVLGTISMIVSPDAPQILGKGLFQVCGVAIKILVCVAMINEVSQRPVLFSGYIRLSVMMLAVVALIAIAQFGMANILGHPHALEFGFLNNWAGGNVWYSRGSLDGMARASSILQEPSALGMVLGLGAGVSLIRIGLIGVSHRAAISSIVPLWAAASILGGFIATVSAIDFLLLFVVAASLWTIARRIGAGVLVSLMVSVVAFVVVVYSASSAALPQLREKLGALSAITSDDLQLNSAEDLSAITLAVNLNVMWTNLAMDPTLGAGLGAHPLTYERQNPGLGLLPADIVREGLNKEDAASLITRLLSETGVLGTLAFIAGWLFALARSRRFILASIAADRPPDAFMALAIGITASMIGVGLACMVRAPQYYAPWFWLPMALTASVPALMERVERASTNYPL
jgi:hypothetical protein